MFKGVDVVVAPGPPKFGNYTGPGDVTNAGRTVWARNAVPVVGVGGFNVEVLRIIAIFGFFMAVVLAQT